MKRTIVIKVLDKLNALEIGDTLDKEKVINEIWGDYNYFVCRTFDVHYAKAKKLIPTKAFKTIKGVIHRLTDVPLPRNVKDSAL
jgi:hypothetical protein